jgi:serine/threonine protein kinase
MALRPAASGAKPRRPACSRISEDHRADHPDFTHLLTRALGLDGNLHVDYLQAEVHVGDAFVLASDGVHDVLPAARIARLAPEGSAEDASRAIVPAALASGTRDNASALVLRVKRLAAMQPGDLLHRGRSLPVPPRLKPGAQLDGWTIDELIADNGVHRLYRAPAIDDAARPVAIKTLHTARANDPQEREMLAHEAWLAARVAGVPGFAEPVAATGIDARVEPNALYFVFAWHRGRTLEAMLAAGPRDAVVDVVAATLALARAPPRLHRLGIVHRDIEPGNLHRGDDGTWRVLDLGVAVSGREPRVLRTLRAGTPSCMKPEQWASADDKAGRLPDGPIEPDQRGRFRRDPKPPSRLRPDVPIWLDHVVQKAVALDPAVRFESAEELVLALERGAARRLSPARGTPLLLRDPAGLLKVGLGVSLLFNLLLLCWLLFLPR